MCKSGLGGETGSCVVSLFLIAKFHYTKVILPSFIPPPSPARTPLKPPPNFHVCFLCVAHSLLLAIPSRRLLSRTKVTYQWQPHWTRWHCFPQQPLSARSLSRTRGGPWSPPLSTVKCWRVPSCVYLWTLQSGNSNTPFCFPLNHCRFPLLRGGVAIMAHRARGVTCLNRSCNC